MYNGIAHADTILTQSEQFWSFCHWYFEFVSDLANTPVNGGVFTKRVAARLDIPLFWARLRKRLQAPTVREGVLPRR